MDQVGHGLLDRHALGHLRDLNIKLNVIASQQRVAFKRISLGRNFKIIRK